MIRPFGALPPLPRTEHNDAYPPYVCVERFCDRAEIAALRALWDEDSAAEGGELQFLRADGPVGPPRTAGTTVMFPSYLAHRVAPVTAGTRWSLVGWIAGPPYR